MTTERLESFGLAVLIASIALFAAAAFVGRTPLSSPTDARDTDIASTIAIALQARSEGRTEHADALLASIAARARSVDGIDRVTPWLETVPLSGVALVLGLAGVTSVWRAAWRRRRAYRLVASELDLARRSDDPGAIVGALFRLRAERSAAEAKLERMESRVDRAAASRPDIVRVTRHSQTDALETNVPDADPHPFHELGRIVEITPILPG